MFWKLSVFVLIFGVGGVCVQDASAQLDTMAVLRRAVEDYPNLDRSWLRLGQALMDYDDLDGAERAFQKALQVNKSAAAYTGLGKVYATKGKGLTQKAFQMFRMALGVDENYAPAELETARFHNKLRNHDAEMFYRRAIELDPNLRVAYQELILWYERATLDWEKELIGLCQQYIARWPDDSMGYYHLALVYVEKHEFDKVYRLAQGAAQRFPDNLNWIPMMAQAEAARGNPSRALALFDRFLTSAPEQERGYYEDLSLIATENQIKSLRSAPDSLRWQIERRFWRTRSGAAMLGADARKAEHYRRVWYALNYFGRHKKPWDKRGEVYIRYGEPDYRSRSGRENEIPPVAVQQFKLQKISQLLEVRGEYRASESATFTLPVMNSESIYYTGESGDYQGEVNNEGSLIMEAGLRAKIGGRGVGGADGKGGLISGEWLWEVRTPSNEVRLNLPLEMRQGIEPAALFDRDGMGNTLMPWESWVYLDIGNGTEFTFTDRYMSGQWDFPMVPKMLWHLELVSEVNNTQPAVEFMSLSSAIPEKFTVPPGVEPLDFYYDLARFRGLDGRPKLEVYFGIPPEHVQSERVGDFAKMTLAHELVLANEEGETVFRTKDERAYQARVGQGQLDGLFVDIADLPAEAGTYQLGVKLVDQLSGKWNLYQQEIEIPSFADSLAISDIELAWVVSETPRAKKFKKGNVWVVPEPTRKFDTRDVYLYYEIYNLTRDEFGQVNYRVDYTIRENVQNGSGVVGVLAGSLKRFFQARQEPEYRVGYERSGSLSDEPVYFELETEKLKPGLKEVLVSITDLNAKKVVSQQAIFGVGNTQ